ncbi:hypothetical protein LTR36_006365 [Oleoguttula mirabilis]|uniref:Uncharacterized protein n=1 Tax=Oleoguttula mirabilis TaxID=1507867 RepID=A0AAV9JUY2_9PEZI|nr:hypothetical protein LTR36_006365 [Oleoguttula mirabilis]
MVADALIYHPAVAHYNRFVATTVGRDKALRTIQYFSRFLAWYTYRTNQPASTVALFDGLKKNLGSVRKAMRLGKFVEHFKAAAVAADSTSLDPVLKYLAVGRQLGYAFYLTFDAMTYIDNAGIRKFEGAARLQKEAYRAWLAGLLCNVVAGVYTLYNLQVAAKKKTDSADAEKTVDLKKLNKDRRATQLQLVSDLCDCTVPGSGLGYVNLDDGIVGLAGTVSSLIGLFAAWARAAQLEKLENKIEHLVNALSTAQHFGGQVSPTPQDDPPPGARKTSEILGTLCAEVPDNVSSSGSPTTACNPCSAMPHESSDMSTSQMASPTDQGGYQSLGVTMSEAEILLDRFKRLMAPGLPFVVLPTEVTAQQLYSQKPFLLHAIVTVTYFHDLPKQQSMVKQLMRDASERMLMNNEKNIGILQGILVFVAWYHPHVFWGQQTTNLLHLAIALTIDMGIDRLSSACHVDFKHAATKAVHGPNLGSRPATLEEHRALAGVFYLTSTLASSFKKIDALSYTKYMDDCLNSLVEAREYDSDPLLVQMVRLQHLAEDTHTTETPSAPMQMYVKAFEADLTKLKESDPCKEDCTLLKLQYLSAEILVWELSLIDLQENKTKPLRTHLEDLYRCIEAIKSFIDMYFIIPVDAYLTVPFAVFGQFAHAFIVLTKLASLDVEGWDFKSLSVDFPQIIDEATSRFDRATKSSPDGLEVDNESFGKWAQKLRWMKQMYEAKFLQENNFVAQARQTAVKTLFDRPEGYDGATMAGAQQPTPPDDVLSGDFFSNFDETFWNSFSGDMDLGFPDGLMP